MRLLQPGCGDTPRCRIFVSVVIFLWIQSEGDPPERVSTDSLYGSIGKTKATSDLGKLIVKIVVVLVCQVRCIQQSFYSSALYSFHLWWFSFSSFALSSSCRQHNQTRQYKNASTQSVRFRTLCADRSVSRSKWWDDIDVHFSSTADTFHRISRWCFLHYGWSMLVFLLHWIQLSTNADARVLHATLCEWSERMCSTMQTSFSPSMWSDVVGNICDLFINDISDESWIDSSIHIFLSLYSDHSC